MNVALLAIATALLYAILFAIHLARDTIAECFGAAAPTVSEAAGIGALIWFAVLLAAAL